MNDNIKKVILLDNENNPVYPELAENDSITIPEITQNNKYLKTKKTNGDVGILPSKNQIINKIWINTDKMKEIDWEDYYENILRTGAGFAILFTDASLEIGYMCDEYDNPVVYYLSVSEVLDSGELLLTDFAYNITDEDIIMDDICFKAHEVTKTIIDLETDTILENHIFSGLICIDTEREVLEIYNNFNEYETYFNKLLYFQDNQPDLTPVKKIQWGDVIFNTKKNVVTIYNEEGPRGELSQFDIFATDLNGSKSGITLSSNESITIENVLMLEIHNTQNYWLNYEADNPIINTWFDSAAVLARDKENAGFYFIPLVNTELHICPDTPVF